MIRTARLLMAMAMLAATTAFGWFDSQTLTVTVSGQRREVLTATAQLTSVPVDPDYTITYTWTGDVTPLNAATVTGDVILGNRTYTATCIVRVYVDGELLVELTDDDSLYRVNTAPKPSR